MALVPHRAYAARRRLCPLIFGRKKFLLDLLPENKVYRISHIGSTAINFIAAKPIADILLETYSAACMEQICDILTENGYVCMSKTKDRISLNKGYTKNGYAERYFTCI